MKIFFSGIAALLLMLAVGCGSGSSNGDSAKDQSKDLTSYSLSGYEGTVSGTAISVVVPLGTDLSALVATFAITGASVSVGSVEQTSGTTANDFTNPVEFVVKAADGSTKTFTVTVTVADYAVRSLQPTATLYLTCTYEFRALYAKSGTNHTLTWKSSDETIATVSSAGIVTPVKTGTVTITATGDAYGFSSASECTVKDTAIASLFSGLSSTDGNYARYIGSDLDHAIPLTIGDVTIKSLSSSSYSGSSMVEYAIVPSTFTSIGENGFVQTAKLVSVWIPSSVTSLGVNAFNNCNKLTDVILEEGLLTIGSLAFGANTALTSITIPSTVTSIGAHAFYNTSLHAINLPSSLVSIGANAFCNITAPSSVTIPAKVTSIGDYAFLGCSNLSSVTLLPSTPPTLGSQVFSSNAGRTFHVADSAAVTAYTAAGWGSYGTIVTP
jgi:hypothetical protein